MGPEPASPLRLAYACAWWHPREATWSYSSTRLRAALREHATVLDVEAQRSLAGKVLLRTAYSLRPGTPWQYSKPERALMDRRVRRGVRRLDPDAVLAVADVDTPSAVPTFLYQDTNIALDTELVATAGTAVSNMLPSSDALRRRLGAERLERARAAQGVFVMSRWFGDFLVRNGVEPTRVIPVWAGMNNPPTAHRDPTSPSQGRVLFVGTDFQRKGGDLVVEAVRRLRDQGEDATLTVVGPSAWPLEGRIPDFVQFRGPLPAAVVAQEYARHDVFAMPSRIEGFGIVFTEALAAGLPCVGRRAFAMPEMIDDGITGELVAEEDAEHVARAIQRLLCDPDVHARVAGRRPELLRRFSWSTVADRIARHVEAVTSSASG